MDAISLRQAAGCSDAIKSSKEQLMSLFQLRSATSPAVYWARNSLDRDAQGKMRGTSLDQSSEIFSVQVLVEFCGIF